MSFIRAPRDAGESGFPERGEQNAQIKRRHRRGTIWRVLFQVSTFIGIIALMTLLYTVITAAFGLVAVQNVVAPESLVLALDEARMLTSVNTVSSEDDNELAQAIIDDPNGIGFLGYAYYQEHKTALNILSVDGLKASAATVEDGTYPLSRPLYLYTTANIMQQNQAASIFVNYLLSHVNEVIEDVGYFPVSETQLLQAQDAWVAASGLALKPGQWPVIDPVGLGGRFQIAGSSTVFPLTERLLGDIQETGFAADASLESVGSSAGLRRFCVDGDIDIANASRTMHPAEFEACRASGRHPLEIHVGTDALVVIVSQENAFLTDVSQAQLRQIFSSATYWSDVDPGWPNEPINRYIPGADSGTLDFFAENVFQRKLDELSKEDLVNILAPQISVGLGRRLERGQRFFDDRLIFEDPNLFQKICAGAEPPEGCTAPARSQVDVYQLVLDRVVQPEVVQTWSLVDSFTRRKEIEAWVQQEHPNAVLEFRSWLTPDFLVTPQSSEPEFAGVRTALFGSLWVVFLTIVVSFPVSVGAAVYLEEYAADNWLNRLIQTNINNLAGVPSIIYGMLGLAIFVRTLEIITSGSVFGAIDDSTTANGRTILSASLTLALLILPLIIINAQEALRSVPNSLRQAGMALGATKWQTIWHHVIPNALPGILTGAVLAMSRAIGETAPLVVVGASTFITADPSGPFAKFTTLPIQIYQWTSRPQDEFRNIAAAAIIVLLILLLTLNATAVVLRNRTTRRLS